MVHVFMRDKKKVSTLWSVPFRVSALERFCYKGFVRNSSETKERYLREVSALEDVRFSLVPLYIYRKGTNFPQSKGFSQVILRLFLILPFVFVLH